LPIYATDWLGPIRLKPVRRAISARSALQSIV